MKNKKIIIPFLACAILSGFAFAEEIDEVQGDTVIVATAQETVQVATDEAGDTVVTVQVTDRPDTTAPEPKRIESTGRPSVFAGHQAAIEAARVGVMTNAASMRAAAPVRIEPTAAAVANDPDLECSPGEKVSGKTCVTCDQKNNPGVIWADSGKDCSITECANDEYVLVDEEKDQPKCLKKCDTWGGVATREWNRDLADFDVCGTGSHTECDTGFVKTSEQTSSSGMKYSHCIPTGTMSGACKNNGSVRICEYLDSRAQQTCENGFWGLCMVNRLCDEDYKESDRRDVFTVTNKKDRRISVFDCIRK